MGEVRHALIQASSQWSQSRPERGPHPSGPLHLSLLKALEEHQPKNQSLAMSSVWKSLASSTSAGLQPVTGITSTRKLTVGLKGQVKLLLRLNGLCGQDFYKAVVAAASSTDDQTWSFALDTAPIDRQTRLLQEYSRAQ